MVETPMVESDLALRNAVDEHVTHRYLGSWKMKCTWLRVRCRLRGTPNWTVNDMASCAHVCRDLSFFLPLLVAEKNYLSGRLGTLDRPCDGL